jgi:integrase
MATAQPFSDSDLAHLLPHLPKPRDKTMVLTGLATGLRISELLALRLADVSPRPGIIFPYLDITGKRSRHLKTHRRIPISPHLVRALLPYLATFPSYSPALFLWPSTHGRNQPITPRQANNILKNAAERAGILTHVSTHSLRKTYAEWIYETSGHDYFLTSGALGHKSPASTVHYLARKQSSIHTLIAQATAQHLDSFLPDTPIHAPGSCG